MLSTSSCWHQITNCKLSCYCCCCCCYCNRALLVPAIQGCSRSSGHQWRTRCVVAVYCIYFFFNSFSLFRITVFCRCSLCCIANVFFVFSPWCRPQTVEWNNDNNNCNNQQQWPQVRCNVRYLLHAHIHSNMHKRIFICISSMHTTKHIYKSIHTDAYIASNYCKRLNGWLTINEIQTMPRTINTSASAVKSSVPIVHVLECCIIEILTSISNGRWSGIKVLRVCPLWANIWA